MPIAALLLVTCGQLIRYNRCLKFILIYILKLLHTLALFYVFYRLFLLLLKLNLCQEAEIMPGTIIRSWILSSVKLLAR